MTITKLTDRDLADVEWTFLHSFPEDEAPITYKVIEDLVRTRTEPPCLNLGFKVQGRVVGAVGFSPVSLQDQEDISAYILAPLAVHEDFQKQGIATRLIEHARQQLIATNVDLLFVYGDPGYYGRYGFDAELGKRFVPPYPLQFDFGWQALMLRERDLKKDTYDFTCVDALSDASLW